MPQTIPHPNMPFKNILWKLSFGHPRTPTTSLCAGTDVGGAGTDVSGAGAGGPSLDQLPMEMVLKIASWLDLSSILRLEQVSSRYRDAGPLLRRQLRVLQVGVLGYCSITSTEVLEVLPQLLELRELHVGVLSAPYHTGRLLEDLVAASRHWQKLETLRLTYACMWRSPLREGKHQQLIQLLENCSRLTDVDVALFEFSTDEELKLVVKALPAVRTFRVYKPPLSGSLSGSFLSQLPAELRHLFVKCDGLRSEAVTELRRFGELRSLTLRLRNGKVQPSHLATGLSGCGRLRRLSVDPDALSQECLLHLPELRHFDFGHSKLTDTWLLNLPGFSVFDVSESKMTDTDLDRFLNLLPSLSPGLESLSLSHLRRVTPEGLATGLRTLSSLPSLRSLDLISTSGVCNRVLAELRSQSLQLSRCI